MGEYYRYLLTLTPEQRRLLEQRSEEARLSRADLLRRSVSALASGGVMDALVPDMSGRAWVG